MAILSGAGLSVAYGHREIFSGLDFEIAEGARAGIVGPNGSGKTSLLRLIAGVQEPDGGAIHRSRGLRTGYVPQVPSFSTAGTLYEEILSAFDGLRALERQIEEAAAEMGKGSSGAAQRHAVCLKFENRSRHCRTGRAPPISPLALLRFPS
jgi:ATP-binding cassette subfamily F protein 3